MGNLFSPSTGNQSTAATSEAETPREDDASRFYENNNLPVDPVPVTAGQKLIYQQEDVLSTITRNNDTLSKQATDLDRKWLSVTTHAKKTNQSAIAFEREMDKIPEIVASITAARRKVERAFVLLESLEEALTAMEMQKEEREFAQWKAFKAEEFNNYRLHVTKDIDTLAIRKANLERELLVKAGAAP